MTAVAAPITDPLESLNRRLSELTNTAAADLELGALRALSDEVVLCGLLGGKDVGKSTLVNSLVGAPISVDADEVGEGTSRPLAYVHESAGAAVVRRLEDLSRLTTIDTVTHRVDAVRNVVLVDLPDFDSEFDDHARIVRQIAPLLDRVLWVVTPRKAGDRAWVSLARRVLKDPGNVHCVLNKVDELLTDADVFVEQDGDRVASFLEAQRRWFLAATSRAGLGSEEGRHFLVAAEFPTEEGFAARVQWLWDDPQWRRYPQDREAVLELSRRMSAEFRRMRDRVLGPVKAEEVRRIKEANRRRECEVGASLLREHFDLDRINERLMRICEEDYRRELLCEGFGPGYVTEAVEQLSSRARSDSRLAEELLTQRLADWPVLGWVYGLFGWLPRWVGQRLASSPKPAVGAPDEALNVSGIGLEERIRLVRSRIASDQADLISRLRLSPGGAEDVRSTAEGLRSESTKLVHQLEERVIAAAREGDAAPSWWKRGLVWFVIGWFPLVQPVLEGVLHVASAEGVTGVAGGLYQIVAALSAVKILGGLVVVTVIYVVSLTIMYARALRDIRAAREAPEGIQSARSMLEGLLMSRVVEPALAPFEQRRAALNDALAALSQVDGRTAA